MKHEKSGLNETNTTIKNINNIHSEQEM